MKHRQPRSLRKSEYRLKSPSVQTNFSTGIRIGYTQNRAERRLAKQLRKP